MNRNIICFCIGVMFLAGIPLCAKQDTAGKAGEPAKKNYSIEIENDQKGRPLRVNFMSPDSEVLKTLPFKSFKGVQISKNTKHLLYTIEQHISDEANDKMTEQGHLNYNVSLYDVKGNLKWGKEFRVNPQHMDVDGESAYWDNGISDDGDRTYVNYCEKDNSYVLVVFDSNGRKISSVKHDLLLHDMEISPDGKLVGGVTRVPSGNKSIKNFFFLDVDTGKTKLIKAEGAGWSSGFILSSGGPLIPGKILLWFERDNAPTSYGRIYLGFEYLANDLSEIFRERNR